MAAKPTPMSKIKQILRLYQQGQKYKAIARTCSISKNTVKKYLLLAEVNQLNIDELLKMDDPALEQLLTSGGNIKKDNRYDYLLEQMDYYRKELKRTGVTRYLLWQEYLEQNRNGYAYSQFCYHLQKYEDFKEFSMVQNHEPGNLLYIDFTGKKMSYVDKSTGAYVDVQVFAGVLGYSLYSFVRAVESQKTEDFINTLSECLVFYQGVPRGIVPDNLKSAVTKTDRFEPELNRLLDDFANHYGTAIIPARSRKPKDKAHVENLVKQIYSNIFAPLRDRTFYSLAEINYAIAEQLSIYNQKQFQKKNISRLELFVSQEKSLLSPLPEDLFELKKYRELTVQKNSHIELRENRNYYSAPEVYIGQKVKVIYTKRLVTIYHKGEQVACHLRSFIQNAYVTVDEHLPSHLKNWRDRSPDYYIGWAKNISPEVEQLFIKLFETKAHPEQAYKSCDGIKSICRKVGQPLLIKACARALYLEQYNYTYVKRIVENPKKMLLEESDSVVAKPLPEHPNIRGKEYYQLKLNL